MSVLSGTTSTGEYFQGSAFSRPLQPQPPPAGKGNTAGYTYSRGFLPVPASESSYTFGLGPEQALSSPRHGSRSAPPLVGKLSDYEIPMATPTPPEAPAHEAVDRPELPHGEGPCPLPMPRPSLRRNRRPAEVVPGQSQVDAEEAPMAVVISHIRMPR
jgi:hypothetical protein